MARHYLHVARNVSKSNGRIILGAITKVAHVLELQFLPYFKKPHTYFLLYLQIIY